jgi:endonuclease I
VQGRGKYTDANNYYAGTEDLWGQALRNALNTKITSGHTSLGYTEGRNRMFSTTIDGYDGNATNRKLDCVYTGRVVTLANGSPRPNASSPDYMNTEHTWPQGFFNSSDPMVSDIHHLFPTDADANNERGNYPFGNVNNRATARCNDMDLGTQNGTCTNQGSGTWSYLEGGIYEVRDVQKGNTARAMMYFFTRYPSNYGNFYTAAQEAVFKQWHTADPPNAKEVARNNGVQAAQGNRNPYVDHPDFIDRIGSFIGTYAAAPQTVSALYFPTTEGFGNVQINTALEGDVTLSNTGTANLSISSVTVDNGSFSIVSGAEAGNVTPGQSRVIKVRFNPTVLGQTETATLSVSSNAGTFTTSLSGTGATSTPTDQESPQRFSLSNAYPNPFAQTAEIRFALFAAEDVHFTLFDMMGRLVYSHSARFEAGEQSLTLDAQTLANGIYAATLSAGNQKQTLKLTVLK